MGHNFTVYMHILPNGKRYIGITSKDPEERWHKGRGYDPHKYFRNAINKYGWDNIQHVIIAQNLTKEEACLMEQQLIEKYDTMNPEKGYNLTKGGFGRLGDKQSDQAKKKISEASKKLWQNQEYRQKMIEICRNQKFTQERKEKISIGVKRFIQTNYEKFLERARRAGKTRKDRQPWNKGKIGCFQHTESTKNKISKTLKGITWTPEQLDNMARGGSLKKMPESYCKMLSERNKKIMQDPNMKKRISDSVKQTMKEKGLKPGQKIKVQCVETGIIYESIKEAKKYTGARTISKAILKGGYSAGYHWRKVE